ncbi:hypothetical protein GGI07_003323 [Coemansia sp. Benny D115]|nr:hypothetical protein GGI07_003323 [Coemansia sp. Benny D115]
MHISCFAIVSLLAVLPSTAYGQSGSGAQRCREIRTRRSAHSLSASEWQRIRSVISQMHRQGHFERFAKSHETVFNDVHGTSAFFPFHRRFVLEFENLGRRIDPEFTVPYWDTTLDYRNPATSPVLRSGTLGGNGQGPDSCLPNGIQGNWQLGYPDRHCIRRRFNRGDSMSPWFSPEIISSYIQSDRSLDDFRKHIEFGIHGATHLGLGGDASTKTAPNDFFFHMHHANIDRLWWLWQNNQENMFDYNGPGRNGEATLGDAIPEDSQVNFGSQPVGSVMILGYNGVCYAYDSAPSPPARFPGMQRSEEDALGRGAGHGAEPMSPIPMISGSSNLANQGLEIARIRKALGEEEGLKSYFPQVAALEPTRLETALANNMGAANETRHCTCPMHQGPHSHRDHMIVYPERMSDAWIKMHGFDPAQVEKVHRDACRLVDLLNNSTYVSPY